MECNRDEALRAKSIAEDKLGNKDFAGARKFANKAQSLYPGLDGISQILTILDVYTASENKINGEADWYGVLGVNPSADDESIKKQYRKLALLLHPDKNKSVGADNAFKLLSEAWSLLSDKEKRAAYNIKRGSRGFQQKVQMQTGGPGPGPSAPPSTANGMFNFTSRMPSVPKTQNNTPKHRPKPSAPKPKPTPAPSSSSQRQDTFWTICHRCKMHYEYLMVYLNHTLLCPNCKEAFMAAETAPPVNYRSSSHVPRQQKLQPASARPPNRSAIDPARNVQKSVPKHPQYQQRTTVGAGGTDSSIAAKAANVVQQAQDKLKRAYTESHASAGWEGSSVQKRRLNDDNRQFGMSYNAAQGNGGFGIGSGSAPGSRFYGNYRQPNSTSDLTPLETRNMLVAKAQGEIKTKLLSWSSKTRESKKVKHKSPVNTQARDQNGSGATGQRGKGQDSHSDDNLSKDDDEPAPTMNVPDPDFHDFDQDRAESSFGDNEVWSAYDDDDGMPRLYALVNKVNSRNPLRLKISFLNSKTTTEFGTLDWVGSGFYKTCGEFRVGKYEICKSMNVFSQKVNWTKGPRGTIIVLPQKGDVWALYKNWKSDWNAETPDEVVHVYEMVTVLDDYNEEEGVRVVPLVKVIGFKTVFRPDLDPEAVRKIPKEEMFRLSHRVPHHLLTGLESPNAPKGYLELDPAATPLELLQVITEEDEAPDKVSNSTEEAS